MPQYRTNLLDYPSVQRELGLTNPVIQKVGKIRADSVRSQLRMISPTPSNPTQARPLNADQALELIRKTDQALLALLSPTQKGRLKQIGLQYAGVLGLFDNDVAQVLQITSAQRAKLLQAIKSRNEGFQKSFSNLMGNGHIIGRDPQGNMKKITTAQIELHNKLVSDATAILTRSQVSVWHQMEGKPFAISALIGPREAPSINVKPGIRR